MRPLIGIPQCLDDRGRWKADRRYHYIDAAYAAAVEEAGGVPLYLPIQADTEALVERIDGLLIPGGDDFAPDAPYPADIEFDLVSSAQLGFDRELLAAALDRDLPTLAICYGMQLLALAFGGRLHHHLPIDVPDAAPHRRTSHAANHLEHELELDDASRLARALAGGSTSVNSLHHQAVAEVGSDLRVAARAPDGVIEGIEHPDHRFCIGVQWHPEKLATAQRTPLFRSFIESCKSNA